MSDYHDIYDRVAKRCLTLSKGAVINFINGSFHTQYPADSKIAYNWTEHTDKELKRTLADAIITINDSFSYQIEFQMSVDGTIVMRAFEYGFHHAQKNQGEADILTFPDPVIIYLYESENVPDVQTLTVRFGSQGEFVYRVPTVKYQELSTEEKREKGLVLLLPFQLLKLRKAIEKERTKENLEALKLLVSHDIIEAIRVNEAAGNLTSRDSQVLKNLTLRLYHHIYDKFKEMEEEGVGEAVEEDLILEFDIIEQKLEQKIGQELEQKFEQKLQRERAAAKKEADALRFLLKGKSTADTAKATGLTEEQIEELRNRE